MPSNLRSKVDRPQTVSFDFVPRLPMDYCRRGTSLLCVALGIFCVTFGWVSNADASSYIGVTSTQIESLSRALECLHHDIGRYPTDEEGLTLLVTPPERLAERWEGPYLKKAVPLDPWEHGYVYHYPARYGNGPFDLYSFGKNGIDDRGDKDDIVSWRPINEEYYGGLSKSRKIVNYLFELGAALAWIAILMRRVGISSLSAPGRFAFANILLGGAVVFSWPCYWSWESTSIPAWEMGVVLCLLLSSLQGGLLSISAIRRGTTSRGKGILCAGMNMMSFMIATQWFMFIASRPLL